ncbi:MULTISPECIES: glycosyltransferase family 9 protein [Yersiniaceae]|uniref:Glycosyltransferase family 9 protein n=1 Tax=Nissabacter archeti TaxID=1917880 RepID=A0ABS5JMT1_9GAMM|nr:MULTISPECIES: glycosyltransferase family 9 protein [Yersiniaceae]MBS0971161.1 glycosyltransferase family 9 protein [Nissabacter archeti]PLR29281.1 glycosyl transferase [Chimaeribacter arupi]PLR45293.1 glycosyl transferase [Chimaeribacter arupi]
MAKKWKTALTNAFLRGYVALTRRLQDPRTLDAQQEFRSIVIYSTTALGDLMFNTPAIRAVKQRYPKAFITLVSSEKNRGLVAESDYFDDVVYWDEKVRDLFSVVGQLRRRQPELAIILHAKPPYDVLSAVLAGCRYILKDIYGGKPCGLERWLANPFVRYNGHLIQRKLDLVARLGCDAGNTDMAIPVPFPLLEKAPGKIQIGFQMGASGQLRCWPVPHFIALAKRLLALGPAYQIVLIGTRKEAALEREFLAGMTAQELQQVVSHIDKTGLKALLGIMNNMDVMVTGDTGPLHLAIALKTPTVSLFVTANPAHTGPYQDPALHRVIQVPLTTKNLTPEQLRQPLCIISADEVFERVVELLPKR